MGTGCLLRRLGSDAVARRQMPDHSARRMPARRGGSPRTPVEQEGFTQGARQRSAPEGRGLGHQIERGRGAGSSPAVAKSRGSYPTPREMALRLPLRRADAGPRRMARRPARATGGKAYGQRAATIIISSRRKLGEKHLAQDQGRDAAPRCVGDGPQSSEAFGPASFARSRATAERSTPEGGQGANRDHGAVFPVQARGVEGHARSIKPAQPYRRCASRRPRTWRLSRYQARPRLIPGIPWTQRQTYP